MIIQIIASDNSTDNSFNYLEKLKPYDFGPTISGDDTTDEEVSGLTNEVLETPKERKRNLHWCHCGKYKVIFINEEFVLP